jgi:hypothetical protein
VDTNQIARQKCGVSEGDVSVVDLYYYQVFDPRAGGPRVRWTDETLADLIFDRLKYTYCRKTSGCNVQNLELSVDPSDYSNQPQTRIRTPVDRLQQRWARGERSFKQFASELPELIPILDEFPYTLVEVGRKGQAKPSYVTVEEKYLDYNRFTGNIKLKTDQRAVQISRGSSGYGVYCVLTSRGDLLWNPERGANGFGPKFAFLNFRSRQPALQKDSKEEAAMETASDEEADRQRRVRTLSSYRKYLDVQCTPQFLGQVIADEEIPHDQKKLFVDSACFRQRLEIFGKVVNTDSASGWLTIVDPYDVHYRIARDMRVQRVGEQVKVSGMFFSFLPDGHVVLR